MRRFHLYFFLPFLLFLSGCNSHPGNKTEKLANEPFGGLSKPYARYWWFASKIKKEDIRYNLNWLKDNGFGGVEIAWVYPLNRFNPKDTTYTPRQEWLSPEWTNIVSYAKSFADSIGLGCDLTFGTLWPFGDSRVTFGQATQRYGDPSWRQTISRSWEHPKTGYVIDHLTPSNYLPYFKRLSSAFPKQVTHIPTNWFIDSWEVESERLWSNDFKRDFLSKFNYDVSPFMDSVYSPQNAGHLYDYMSLVSEKVLRFYRDFDSTLNVAGVYSRGQVSGAPCDLISGYASLDIPEGESMLFEPEFCSIPASAALLSGKNSVSSETFTCIYGWPADYQKKEQIADLKLVADALFSNGVNQIIWHGKAHNPAGQDTVHFYATTHIGPSGSIARQLPAFNKYLETVSSYMKKGQTLSDIAVWLPTEDSWMAGKLSKNQQFIWAWGAYEMRYVYLPDELKAYNPSWINYEFLKKGTLLKGVFRCGNGAFRAIYIGSKYLDYKVVERLEELSSQGLPIILKRTPVEPGSIIHPDYQDLIDKIKASRSEITNIPGDIEPFISGSEIPTHWTRIDKHTLYVFFPNPKSSHLKFPLGYGQSLDSLTLERKIKVSFLDRNYSLDLSFKPNQSLLYKLDNGTAEKIDIEFIPETPVVKLRPQNYKAPWLVY